MPTYKTKWYLGERITVGKVYIRQDLGAFSTYSRAHKSVFNWVEQPDGSLLGERKPGYENLFPHNGKRVLERPTIYRFTRALTVAEADALTQEWVDTHVDWPRAARTYEAYPRKHPSKLVDYTPDYEWCWDECMGDVWAHVWLDIDQFAPGEGDWRTAMCYESTWQYVEWYRQGHMPPPLFVLRHIDGGLISLNRRRWLAAREAGVKSLPCWYSPTDCATGKPLWERRTCIYDRARICTVYRAGGDCTTCTEGMDVIITPDGDVLL